MQSPHFRVHYYQGLEKSAHEVIAIAEEVHARLTLYFKWQPKQKTDIVLTDEIDMANGFSQPFPSNRIGLFLTAPDDGLFDYAGWLESLISHEYTHTLHLDMASGTPKKARQTFGRHPVLFPGVFQPLWLIEGLATYVETDSKRGIGRGQSSYYDMLMRTEVAAGFKPLKQVNQFIRTWPTGTTPYLYGYYFYKFVEDRYGVEKMKALLTHYRSNLIPFRLNSNSTAVLGRNLPTLWKEYERYLREKYEPQMSRIRDRGIIEGTQLTHHGYATSQTRITTAGSLFYIRADGRSDPALMVIEPNELKSRRLVRLNNNARFDIHESAGIVVAQPERHRNANLFYDLYHVDINTRRIKRLTHGRRYRFAAWSPNGDRLAAVQNMKGKHRLHLLDKDGTYLETLWQGINGELLSYIDWSPISQTLVAVVWRPKSGWNLEEFDINARRWRSLTSDTAIQLYPQYTLQGDAVLFSADYGGVYNVQRLDLATKKIETITNVRSGAFYPSMSSDGALFYAGYDSQGYDVYRMVNQTKVLDEPEQEAGTTAQYRPIPEVSYKLSDTAYQVQGGLKPTWWSPFVFIDSDFSIAGVLTGASDSLQRHSYTASVGYELEYDGVIGEMNYVYDRWYPVFAVKASRDISLQRSSDNNVSRVRYTDFYNGSVTFPFLYQRRRWAFHVGLSMEKKSDHKVKSGFSSSPDQKDGLAGLAFSYDSTRLYVRSISRSNGRSVSLLGETSDVIASDYSGDVFTLDWREFLSLGREHVLALRFVHGWGDDAPRNFKLGGSDSAGTVLSITTPGFSTPFNRRNYALRGYKEGINELRGRRMRLLSAEWRFPIVRPERGIMAPPLAISQVSGGLFVDSGDAWNEGSDPDEYYTGVGFEINADMQVFYNFPLRLRLGIATGLDNIGEDQAYLNLGAAF